MAYDRLVGVYDADGGLRGEVAYLLGHLIGMRECALCDITHSAVRRKPAWDRLVAHLPVPLSVVHRNEIPPGLAAAVAGHRLPAVFGVAGDRVELLLDASVLSELDGSVEQFGRRLRASAGLPLP